MSMQMGFLAQGFIPASLQHLGLLMLLWLASSASGAFWGKKMNINKCLCCKEKCECPYLSWVTFKLGLEWLRKSH